MIRLRLLVLTQAVDLDDPVLSFFHRWIEEFSGHCDAVEVICLRKGRFSLPPNVAVHSLGKERGLGRLAYIANFYRLIWRLRHSYDAVFVHMNPEYVVLGGVFWKVLKKPVGFWFVHKSVTVHLRIAAVFANHIFSASRESIRISSTKIHITGHGIDTDFFSPDPAVVRGRHMLSVGRLMPSKRHDLAIREAAKNNVPIRIAGDGPLRKQLESLAHELHASVTFLGGISQTELRDEYRRASTLIHRSETGSLDKVVLEAAACGCSVDTSDPALARLPLSPEYVRSHHSLKQLIPAIVTAY